LGIKLDAYQLKKERAIACFLSIQNQQKLKSLNLRDLKFHLDESDRPSLTPTKCGNYGGFLPTITIVTAIDKTKLHQLEKSGLL